MSRRSDVDDKKVKKNGVQQHSKRSKAKAAKAKAIAVAAAAKAARESKLPKSGLCAPKPITPTGPRNGAKSRERPENTGKKRKRKHFAGN